MVSSSSYGLLVSSLAFNGNICHRQKSKTSIKVLGFILLNYILSKFSLNYQRFLINFLYITSVKRKVFFYNSVTKKNDFYFCSFLRNKSRLLLILWKLNKFKMEKQRENNWLKILPILIHMSLLQGFDYLEYFLSCCLQ